MKRSAALGIKIGIVLIILGVLSLAVAFFGSVRMENFFVAGFWYLMVAGIIVLGVSLIFTRIAKSRGK